MHIDYTPGNGQTIELLKQGMGWHGAGYLAVIIVTLFFIGHLQ